MLETAVCFVNKIGAAFSCLFHDEFSLAPHSNKALVTKAAHGPVEVSTQHRIEDVARGLGVFVRLHRIGRPALRETANLGGVAKHLGE